jgi:hypothetical protein
MNWTPIRLTFRQHIAARLAALIGAVMATTFSASIDFDLDGHGAGDDVSPYVISARAEQGMYSELDHTAMIGVCSLVLDNGDKRFSPSHAAGPLYGKLLPARPVRIQATDGITTWTIFQGFTRSFNPDPDPNGPRTCAVACEDILGQLQRARIALPLQTDQTMSELLLLIGAEACKSAYATGLITLSGLPSDGDTVTVGTITYTFRTTPSVAYEVAIGVLGESEHNLAAAINAAEGVGTIYGADTERHPLVTADHAPYFAETTQVGSNSIGYVNKALAVQMIWTTSGTLDRVRLMLSENATAAPDLTVKFVTDYNSLPSTTLTHANATATVTAADVTPALAWLEVDFPGFFTVKPGDWLVLESSSGASDPAEYFNWGANTTPPQPSMFQKPYASGAWEADSGNPRTFNYEFQGKVYITATARGAWGNSIALAENGAVITVSGAALSGGTDGPDLRSYQTGRTTFPYAGDQWDEGRTTALRALSDVIANEPGLLWVARNGTLTAKDRQWQNAQTTVASALTLNNAQIDQDGILDDERIANHIVVSYTPRGEQTNSIVARASYSIEVPGRGFDDERWTRNKGLPSSGAATVLQAGAKTVRLPFAMPDSGTLIGAKDVVHPVAGTDFTITDYADGSGWNYTNDGLVTISMVILGSGIELTFSNRAMGSLYLHGFQIRGTRLLVYETKEVVRENEASIAIYGRRTLPVRMELINDENLATALANWLLGRYKTPTYVIRSEQLEDATGLIGGVHPLSVEIGNMLTISETQTGVSAAKYLVQGIETELDAGGAVSRVAWWVRPLGDVTYWILGDATYGVLGSTTRLGI